MTLSVFKYEITIEDEVEITLPYAARILDVQPQHDMLCLWALVNPENPEQIRRFRIAGTGHPINYEWTDLTHISTFQMYGGDLVFHVFEVRTV